VARLGALRSRTFIALLFAVALAGCGDGEEPTTAPRDAADLIRANHAAEAVYLQRVLGDDPTSESVSLRVNGTAAVRRGGGRGYHDIAIELSKGEADRALALVRRAPFAALADNTITPGGFAGDDNGWRYMLRRGGDSVTIAEADLPPAMRRLVKELNGLIDGDVGRIVADDRHYSASSVTGSVSSSPDSEPVVENAPTTPLQEPQAAPEAQTSLSCYGWGGRQSPDAVVQGTGAGPLVFDGLGRSSRGRVVRANAVVQPGGDVTVSVPAVERDRVGLLYGIHWRGAHSLANAEHTVRFEGCTDTTEGGGPARFDGGVVVRGRGCATLLVYVAARDEPVRRRVACG
jgi:hypothetical protein